eukprot:scaffold21972_cov123-Isochrysis_galbana.AAC.3
MENGGEEQRMRQHHTSPGTAAPTLAVAVGNRHSNRSAVWPGARTGGMWRSYTSPLQAPTTVSHPGKSMAVAAWHSSAAVAAVASGRLPCA